VHHVGILCDQFMMHGQRNIKALEVCLYFYCFNFASYLNE